VLAKSESEKQLKSIIDQKIEIGKQVINEKAEK